MIVRLGKLIRLLASDKPGEVVAAAAAIDRSLRSAGLDIHRLADVVDRSALDSQSAPDHSQTAETDWHEIRDWCAVRADRLSARERQFIDSMTHWRGQPTEKQMTWLVAIEQRLRARSP
jgi:hypothetical protein